ncbi:MAG: S-layer homology domain-containing protein, partial [Clostridiales bacterium]|nr:S-layer homology domain-containing protein [Clostridiales bacterium]
SDVEDAFVDVPKEHWAHDTILSAYAKGWISGYPGDIFLPENAITRAETVAIVNRILGRRLRFEDVDLKYHALYPDLTPAHWAFADMIEASVDHHYRRTEDAYEIWRQAL